MRHRFMGFWGKEGGGGGVGYHLVPLPTLELGIDLWDFGGKGEGAGVILCYHSHPEYWASIYGGWRGLGVRRGWGGPLIDIIWLQKTIHIHT